MRETPDQIKTVSTGKRQGPVSVCQTDIKVLLKSLKYLILYAAGKSIILL